MSDAIHRRDEADRLLNEPLLKKALENLAAEWTDALLNGPPPSVELPQHDQWRREKIDSINAVRRLYDHIRTALHSAEAEMRTRGSVA